MDIAFAQSQTYSVVQIIVIQRNLTEVCTLTDSFVETVDSIEKKYNSILAQ
jgi:hypothetical protein